MTDEETYSLQNIVDHGALGSEPSESYKESLDVLDNVVRECMYVSRSYAGISSPTGRHFYASVLFTVMITRGVSLLTLAPHTPWADKQIEHWDYGSMTGLARTMIELRAAFHYLCTEACSADEWDFRWNLFNLHDCVSRIRMFGALGDDEQLAGFLTQAEELRERLTSNPFLETVDPKRRKRLLHGQTAYLFPLEDIAERAGIEVPVFRYLYVLFSSHVHALPMSFYRIGGENAERGRGLPSPTEENYSALCLSLAASLLVNTRDEMHDLFDGLKQPEPDPRAEPEEIADTAELAVGETMDIELTEAIHVRFERTEANEVLSSYIHRASGEIILERAEMEDGSVELRSLDPYFWNFKLNGEAVIGATLEEVLNQPHAFRVDHNTREIMFKTDGSHPSSDIAAGAPPIPDQAR